jgi:hypothetical protein
MEKPATRMSENTGRQQEAIGTALKRGNGASEELAMEKGN